MIKLLTRAIFRAMNLVEKEGKFCACEGLLSKQKQATMIVNGRYFLRRNGIFGALFINEL
jgi:hypothetical protein